MKLKGARVTKAVAMVDGRGKPHWETFQDIESLRIKYPLATRADCRNVVVMTEAEYLGILKRLPEESDYV